MIIWHLADIHFGKIKQVTLNNFYEKARALPKPDTVVIAGDLFDSSLFFEDDNTGSALDFIEELKGYSDNIIISKGTSSHDRHNLKSLKKIFKDIAIYDEIGEHDEFCVVPEPVLSTMEETIEILNSTKKPYIIFHGSIEGSAYPSGVTVENVTNSFISSSLFKKFKLGLLGHIHMPQNVAGNCYYSGSLGRWSFGEEHAKGFFIHDTDNIKNPTFVEIESPAYKTYTFTDNEEAEEFLKENNFDEMTRVITPKALKTPASKNIKILINQTSTNLANDSELTEIIQNSGLTMYDKVLLYAKNKLKETLTDSEKELIRKILEKVNLT